MSLTVLTDSNVRQILRNVTREEVESLQASLRKALHEYSTGTTNSGACAENQPERTVTESNNGTTTLFMPSISSTRIGVKVVTLASSSVGSSSDGPQNNTTPQGALALMTSDGKPFGFVNAEEVTAFRTALASSLLVVRRKRVRVLTVFGVGKQAFWHVRLCLLFHGSSIKKVHFITRDFNERARELMKKFVRCDEDLKKREGWTNTKFDLMSTNYNEHGRILKDDIREADIVICTTPSTQPLFDESILTNTEGRKKGRLIIAVGSYKKHMIEVPTEVIFQAVKRHGSGHHFHKHAEEGGVVVVDTLACLKETGEMVGIQPNQSVELGELVMIEEMAPSVTGSAIEDSPKQSLEFERLSFTDGSSSKGSSISQVFREDSFDSTASGSGNSTGSGSTPSRKSSQTFHSRTGSTGSLGRRKKQQEKDDHMCRWLSSGNVIYKSVGMALMDLVVGGDLVKMARAKGVGVTVPNF